jgi:peptidoglycan/xylan/chitin deacetylase (PgdA/CDA1 family)
MKKRTSIIVNVAIAVVLVGLSIAVFSVDMGRIYTTVAAPITNGNRDMKNVSFMICVEADSDGAAVDQIMNTLALRKVSATFFVTGSWVMRNPQKLQTMHTLGFEIANHGFSGKDMKPMKAEQQKKEILDNHTLVKGLTGVDMKLFMPPVGNYSKDLLKVVSGLGYTVVLSCCDTKSKEPNASPSTIFTLATENTKNGHLILVCPTPQVVQALPSILDFYLNNEFGVVKVSDNIAV